MADGMEMPQISRSGRVLKKSAKVKEMEDFDINELDVTGKSRKKVKAIDEFEDYDDKRVAPIKIPKISFNMQGTKRKMGELSLSTGKQQFKPSFQNSMKGKTDVRRQIYHDSSDASKGSDSSSVSSESSSSSSPTSSDASDDDDPYNSEYRNDPRKVSFGSIPVHQEKVIVEHQQQRYESPVYMEPSSDMSSDDSEDGTSDTALVIAEDSDESANYAPGRGQRGNAKKRAPAKKDPSYAPRQGGRKKPPPKATESNAKKKKQPAGGPVKSKPLSAYMLWCSENRKRIAASAGNIGFSNIGKKMGEAWQALPEKEKLAWKRKAKRLAMKSTGNIINTGATTSTQSKTPANITDELIKGLTENAVLGTAPIDAAAHMKLLGDSLTVIGQRLIEHEGQLAVSGIYSVLLDTLLCAIAPLLCLTTEITGLEHLDTSIFKKTLDHIAYFMPGL